MERWIHATIFRWPCTYHHPKNQVEMNAMKCRTFVTGLGVAVRVFSASVRIRSGEEKSAVSFGDGLGAVLSPFWFSQVPDSPQSLGNSAGVHTSLRSAELHTQQVRGNHDRNETTEPIGSGPGGRESSVPSENMDRSDSS
jgi:hypothetical protein